MIPSPNPTRAFVRIPSRSLADCELTHLPRQAFDLDRAVRQHAAYVRTLEAAGLRVTVLPEAPDLPDAVFVEDPVVVLDELAVLCRPGAPSRWPEVALMESAVAGLRQVFCIQSPGTLEGGDVLRIGRTLFTGRSGRTNAEGIAQLRRLVAPYGYTVTEVSVNGCLHLKTAVTSPAPGLLLANPGWVDMADFGNLKVIAVPDSEPRGANTLPVNGCVLVCASAPRTAEQLRVAGLEVVEVDVSELEKAEAGLTCLSVLYTGTLRDTPA